MTLGSLKDRPVADFMPHAPPMVLLDRVVSIGDEYFEAELVLRPDSLFCDGEAVDAWVGIEYMAQAVAAFAGAEAVAAGRPVKTGFLLGTRSYACRAPRFPVGAVVRVGVKKVLHGTPGSVSVVECSLREKDAAEPWVTAQLTVYEVDDLAAYLAEHAG